MEGVNDSEKLDTLVSRYEQLDELGSLVTNDTVGLQKSEKCIDAGLDGFIVGAEHQVWLLRGLVHAIDASESFDQPSASLLVQSLGVTVLHSTQHNMTT
jgi:hypothetical protein